MNTFVNFLHAALLAGTPLMFGTLGEIVTEKAGNLNLGVEGMMSIGAIAGFYVAYHTKHCARCAWRISRRPPLRPHLCVFDCYAQSKPKRDRPYLDDFCVGFANFFGDFLRESAGIDVLKLSDKITNTVQASSYSVLSDIPYVGKLFFQYNPFVLFWDSSMLF